MANLTSDEKEFLKSHLREYVESITKHSIGKSYVCPICGSGTGKNHSGAFNIDNDDPTFWKCFSCEAHGDIFDLIAAVEGLDPHSDFMKLVDAARKFVGYDNLKFAPPAKKQPPEDKQPVKEEKPLPNYRDFFLQAKDCIEDTTYHRGISLETLKKYEVGYCANWKSPKTPNAPSSPRLIIPTSKYSYLARDTRDPETLTDLQKRFCKQKEGPNHFFNVAALTTAMKPIFITEGEIDALSIIDVGGEAVALGGIGNIDSFVQEVQRVKPVQPLIVAMDSDPRGKEAAAKLVEGLQQLGATVGNFVVEGRADYEGIKDANDLLQKDREQLKSDVMAAMAPYRDEKETYLVDNCVGYHMKDFMKEIKESAGLRAIPTGFPKLDEVLDGGLYKGLYTVGAISSLGKTTLVMQIADNIAKNGQDVLIFSLEMARSELMARSISRHTLEIQLATGGNVSDAKTIKGILCGDRYEWYSDNEIDLIYEAMGEYASYANHLYILEGEGNIGAMQIKKAVEKHISFTGNTPVVVIDYLQILAPYNERGTDKQNTDKAVMELRRLARQFNIPVIAISSLNRASYRDAISMESFKESGAIEYSSDVLIGLQLKGAGPKDFDADEAKAKDPREIELKILKNRNGRTGDMFSMEYRPKFNYFKEA